MNAKAQDMPAIESHKKAGADDAQRAAASIMRAAQQARLRGVIIDKPLAHQSGLGGDAAQRKACPVLRGVLDYFPDAIAAVANCSYVANEQHNPGEPMHWARKKSTDHGDCLVRHLMERGKLDGDGVRHSAKVAWRALALLQAEIEAERSAATAGSD